MKLSVVVVNYCTGPLLAECLGSLANERERGSTFRVVVVDNQSPDDSLAFIREQVALRGWGGWIECLPQAKNGGFAFGNNAALRADGSRHVEDRADAYLLLNPDTLVHPGALAALLDCLEAHPRAGVVGAALEGEDGTLQASAFRFHSVWSELESGLRWGVVSRLLSSKIVALPPAREAQRVDWVSGACLLVRREVLERVGQLDEGYFMYFEETDLCLRAARAGFECWTEPRARVVHLEGKSWGDVDEAKRVRRARWWIASRGRYFRKNHGVLTRCAADLAWTAGRVVWEIRRRLQGKPAPPEPMGLGDFLRHNFLSFLG